MIKKIAKIWIFVTLLIISTILALGQEEIPESGSLNKITNLANKIGIPLTAEQLSSSNAFFQTYGFTIIISIIILIALLLLIHNYASKFAKIGTEIKHIEQSISRSFILSLSKIKKKTGEELHQIKERKMKKIAAKLKEEKEKKKLKEEVVSQKVVDYKQIKAKYKKLPKDSANMVKLEVDIARKIEDEKGRFSVASVLKKIDELYPEELTRQDRINHYESVRRWTKHGELCQEAGKEKGVKYFKFI